MSEHTIYTLDGAEYVNIGGIRCKASILQAREARITLHAADLVGVTISTGDGPGSEVYGFEQGRPLHKVGNPKVAANQRRKYRTLALAADADLRNRGVDLGCERRDMEAYAMAFV